LKNSELMARAPAYGVCAKTYFCAHNHTLHSGQDIQQAKTFLEQGELVAIPTETVYGLAANGLNADAVLKIYKAKNRPSFNPLILHVPYLSEAKKLVKYFPAKALQLAEAFWPGPLTLVLPKNDMVPDITTAGNKTVAIRVPNHPLTLQLLRQLNFPLAAPSANPSGYVSPTTAEHVMQQLGNEVKYVLDGGACSVGVESTIVKVDNEDVTVLRLGGLPVEEIEEIVGEVQLASEHGTVEAPGMMTSHYAPKVKVIIGNIEENLKKFEGKRIGVLFFKDDVRHQTSVVSYVLSPSGNLEEAARNIFSYLRKLDELNLEVILTELVPDEGLGRAINDRVKRAGAER
jgi:L-threonylcarbamoyladenylate synthase